MQCIDNIDKLSFAGNSGDKSGQAILFKFNKCSSDCKSKSETDKFYESRPRIKIAYNQASYRSDDYTGNLVARSIETNEYLIDPQNDKLRQLHLTENLIEAEEDVWSLGIDVSDVKYHQLTESSIDLRFEQLLLSDNSKFAMLVVPKEKGTRHSRSIYTVWDSFADIGGLCLFLYMITFLLVQFLTESSMISEINASLFYKRPSFEIYDETEQAAKRTEGMSI